MLGLERISAPLAAASSRAGRAPRSRSIFFSHPATPSGASRSGSSTSTFRSRSAVCRVRADALEGAAHLWKQQEGADLESYVAIHAGHHFGVAHARHRVDAGRRPRGVLWWAWDSKQLVSSSSSSSSTAPISCSVIRSTRGITRANVACVYALFGVVLPSRSASSRSGSRAGLYPSDGVHERWTADDRVTMFFVFCVALAGIAHDASRIALPGSSWSGKRLESDLNELREVLTT